MSSRFFGRRRINVGLAAASLGLLGVAVAGGCLEHTITGGSSTGTGTGTGTGTTTGTGTGTVTGTGTGTSTGSAAPVVGENLTCANDTDPATCTCGAATLAENERRYFPGYNYERPAEIDELVKAMTLDQKIKQMVGTDSSATAYNWSDLQRSYDVTLDNGTKIRGYMYRDGPRGVNLEAKQWNNRVKNGTNYATAFPATSAIGASWDIDLAYRVGEAQGDEVSASKNSMLLVPCMNILRHPAWGRSQETYGEDVYHIGRMASALGAGVQQYVAGCAKHFAANNIEMDRFNQNAEMDEQTLREIYARHFEMVVQDGGIACVMAAYNAVNAVKSTQNKHLLRDILKAPVSQNGMGFRGLVISDWWAMPAGTDGKKYDIEIGQKQANTRGGLEAGMDIEVAWALNYAQIPNVVGTEAGRLPVSLVDEAVGRILEQKARFGVLYGEQGSASTPWEGWSIKTPTTRLDEASGSIVDNEGHLALAEEAAVKSMVLLKNESNTLPIQGSGKKIVVLGADVQYLVRSDESVAGKDLQTVNFATDLRTGDRGSSRVASDPNKSTTPFQGIEAAGLRAGVTTVTSGKSAADAADADFIVVVAGLTAEDEGEEYTGANDRKTFNLDDRRPEGQQDELIQAVAALNKPMVVVLEAGSIIEMPWLADVPAVVMAWYPGQQGGAALGKLLFGEANFSGKLPVTWGHWDQWPTFSEGGSTRMGYYIGYRMFDQEEKTPVFPFGWGLSYTKFEYSNLKIPCGTATKDGFVPVTVDIKNTGTVDGEEVAMLFSAYPQANRGESKFSKKELKGFTKIAVPAGETKTATITLRIADLKYWRVPDNKWDIESGDIEIKVGPNANDLPLTGTLTIQ